MKTENPYSQITSKEVESVIKNLTTKKSPVPDGFAAENYKTVLKIDTNPTQVFSSNWRAETSSKLITLPAMPEKDTTGK